MDGLYKVVKYRIVNVALYAYNCLRDMQCYVARREDSSVRIFQEDDHQHSAKVARLFQSIISSVGAFFPILFLRSMLIETLFHFLIEFNLFLNFPM